MRTPIVILAGTLLVACASGTRVVYVPVPASTPAPAAPPPARVIPAPLPPVGVTIARVEDSRLLVSTNQPAYLAVFEIVPNRGVTLVYPAAPRQRQLALAGSNWLNVSWRSSRGMIDDDVRDRRGRRLGSPEHHVYVVASERPLRLTDNAFNDAALATMLGARLTQAADPYETMAALSRRFVPPGKDEDWGEDVYTMDVARPIVTARVTKVYCPDGSVVYVRDDMADRAACPWRGQGRNTPAPRPDSVVASNGRRVGGWMSQGPRIFRVPIPAGPPNAQPANGGDVADGRPTNGNAGNNGNNGNNGNGADDSGRDKPKGNNGNHYGWGNGNGNEGKDRPAGTDGKDKNNGGNVANGNGNGNDGKDKSNNGNHYGQEKGNNGNGSSNGQGDAGVQQQGKPERPPQAQPNEAKPAETKPEPKPVAEPAARDEPKPKQEEKPEAKPEPKPESKGMRGVMERMRAKVDSSDAKDKKGKPDRD